MRHKKQRSLVASSSCAHADKQHTLIHLVAAASAYLSAGVMSPPIPVMSSGLPDAAAYASDLAPPNVQVVRRELPTPDG